MAFNVATLINNNQTTNDADGVVTGTMPGASGNIVVCGVTVNSGVATFTISDNGSGGWTSLLTSNPDVVQSNTDAALWAKKMTSADVGATVTITSSTGGMREPAVLVAYSGRSTVADILVARTSDIDGNNTVSPAGVDSGTTAGYDVMDIFFTRVATATKISLTTPGGSQVKVAESATNFGGSPNMAVSVTNSDNVGTGAHGGNTATFNQTIDQAIVYTLGLKPATASPPTVNAGPDLTNIEPYSVVTLSGSASASSGTISSLAWSGAGFTFLTGQNSAVVTAKVRGSIPGETITATLTAVDSNGLSNSDTVGVTTLPVTERAAVNGVMVPLEIRQP